MTELDSAILVAVSRVSIGAEFAESPAVLFGRLLGYRCSGCRALLNPLRTDFQRHYEDVVADYNREKDRVTIEKTFEALLKLAQALDQEEQRAMREGLDEESLAVFDLLNKPELRTAEIKRIKAVAGSSLKP